MKTRDRVQLFDTWVDDYDSATLVSICGGVFLISPDKLPLKDNSTQI
ncbi:MAG: hypothetical protein MUO67_07405 [Anaerolineales bacterium]|nr:hypothetical protein [Anaerolineales bacterium]